MTQQKDVSSGDPFRGSEPLLAGELAVHHGNTPVTATIQAFRCLQAVAVIAKPAAGIDRLLADRQSVVAGRRRAGHHALSDPIRERLFQGIAAERKDQDADSWAAVGRLVDAQHSLDRDLGVAGDHAGRIARHRPCGHLGPLRRVCRDDRARGGHREGFGERVNNLHAVQSERAIGRRR